jgi:hypothetical protein
MATDYNSEFEQAVMEGLGQLGTGQRLQQEQLSHISAKVETLAAEVSRVNQQAALALTKAEHATTIALTTQARVDGQGKQIGQLVGWPIPVLVLLTAATFVLVLIETILFGIMVSSFFRAVVPSTIMGGWLW